MILTDSRTLEGADLSRYVWSGLQRFHHVPFVTQQIIELMNVPRKYHSNVRKQAGQIRHCLIQAREYKDAAAVTSLATRPVLLYYSLMSLALAEILLKSDGGSSLDAARGKHAHHGLVLKVKSMKRDVIDLASDALGLVAEPMSGNKGTFELWHRVAREDPIVGEFVSSDSSESTSQRSRIFFTGSDRRIGQMPPEGISLMYCFLNAPGMMTWLDHNGYYSHLVRGRISA
jgi:hypothetical protein